MINIFSNTLIKIWRRVSGIEPRQLYRQLLEAQNELKATQNELKATQNELANILHYRKNRIHPYVAEALSLVAPDMRNSERIGSHTETKHSIFSEFGSDKDTRHSYGQVYLQLLDGVHRPNILEIGVGSINNYPYAGLPAGGALKAFQKKFQKSKIVGVDIDPDSINEIKNLGFQGFIVDQTSDESLTNTKDLLSDLGPFDLIIDDGFHDPHANVRTLKSYFSLLNQNGTYVIEDVHESLIDFWKSIAVHLPGRFEILDMRELRPGVDDNILIIITN